MKYKRIYRHFSEFYYACIMFTSSVAFSLDEVLLSSGADIGLSVFCNGLSYMNMVWAAALLGEVL